ncbi:MAG: DUF4367 domain-containing protein [Bacillota bacterium]
MGIHRSDVEEKLMSYEKKTDHRIDVRTGVMERIYTLPPKRAKFSTVKEQIVAAGEMEQLISLPPKKARFSLVKKPMIMAVSLLLITSLSITVYAATELLQIRSKEGKVLLETKLEETEPLEDKLEKLNQLMTPYTSIGERSALPGENIVYYIHDKEINDLKKEIHGSDELLEFATGGLSLGVLPTFQEEAKKRGVPNTNYPYRLANDYTFKEGHLSNIGPSGLFDDKGPNERYYEIQNELIRQAEASTNNKKVFVKVLDSPKVSSVWLTYAKGRDRQDYINVFVTMRSGIAEKQQIYYSEKDIVEKVTVKGQEMIYIQSVDNDQNLDYQVKQALRWVDEQNDLEYSISNSVNSNLTKEDILKVAENFIQ